MIEFGFPLIFLDKTKRFFLISLAMTIIFCVFSAILKSAKVCELDILYAVVFYFISFLPSFYLTKIRVREFSLRQLIETERDTDELTGLLNKAAFVREAKKNLAATKNGILIILDLDSFKKINDLRPFYRRQCLEDCRNLHQKCFQKFRCDGKIRRG